MENTKNATRRRAAIWSHKSRTINRCAYAPRSYKYPTSGKSCPTIDCHRMCSRRIGKTNPLRPPISSLCKSCLDIDGASMESGTRACSPWNVRCCDHSASCISCRPLRLPIADKRVARCIINRIKSCYPHLDRASGIHLNEAAYRIVVCSNHATRNWSSQRSACSHIEYMESAACADARTNRQVTCCG